MTGLLKKLGKILLMIGPGLFCVGYTIGTGSITTMIKSGSEHGTALLWVVALSCIFSGVLMEAYGRFALVTGRSAMNAFRTELPCGNLFSGLTVFMVIAGQWCCLSGLVGLSSEALYRSVSLVCPDLYAKLSQLGDKTITVSIAILILASLYTFFWFGNYSRIEKILVFLVTVLGLSFIASLFIVPPPLKMVAQGLIPTIPEGSGSVSPALLVAAMVGTTLAAPTFAVRPLLVLSKGWTKDNLSLQTRDTIISAIMMFIVSGAAMCCAAGVIYCRGGEPVEKFLDMIQTLQPLAGKKASLIFIAGFVSAGLSSILPITMIAGFLVGDFRGHKTDVQSTQFRILTGIAALTGLTVPILGKNPMVAQILTQIVQVFALPLIIIGILVLINKKRLMGEHRAGIALNFGIVASLLFALVISYQAIGGFKEKFLSKPASPAAPEVSEQSQDAAPEALLPAEEVQADLDGEQGNLE